MIHDEQSDVTTPTMSVMSPFNARAALGQVDRHLEITKLTQDGMITGTQEIVDRWCARRRQSAEALAKLGHDALAAKSPQDVMQIWVHWSKGVMDRLLEDAKDQMAAGASAARQVASGTTAMALSWTPSENQYANGAERLNGETAGQKPVRH